MSRALSDERGRQMKFEKFNQTYLAMRKWHIPKKLAYKIAVAIVL